MSAKLQKPTRRNKKDIAERLKAARAALELSQQALADKTKISRSSIVHYERGTVIPGGQELIKLSTALKVTPNYLLGVSEKFPDLDAAIPPLDEMLSMIHVLIFFPMLDKSLKDALSTIVLSSIKARLPQKEYDLLMKMAELMKPHLAEMFPNVEALVESVLDKKNLDMMESELIEFYES